VLVASHGPFAWGGPATEAVEHAAGLEHAAQLAFNAVLIEATLGPIPYALLERHFRRKHGPTAYYSQR
jgi:L-ribulose-5-phosphate 4-epimerase